MATVTEDLDLPVSDLAENATVDVWLADPTTRRRLTGFHNTTKSIVGDGRITVDAETSTWTQDLTPNSDIEPAGTCYMRVVRIGSVVDSRLFTVPTGAGPEPDDSWPIRDLFLDPLDPVPDAEPSNEVDVVEITTASDPVTGSNGFSLVPIPDAVIEVPDVDQPVWIEVDTALRVANANLPAVAVVALAPASESQTSILNVDVMAPRPMPDFGTAPMDAAVSVRHRLPARSPGLLQLFAGGHANDSELNPTAVEVTLSAADWIPTRMTVLAV